MSVLIDKHTRLVVQGITGRDGAFHTQQMIAYGTKVVGGVTPGKAGEEARRRCSTRWRTRSRPRGERVGDLRRRCRRGRHPRGGAGLQLIASPNGAHRAFHHVLRLRGANNPLGRPRLVGPNCPGLITPGQSKVGILPGHICTPGPVGVVSKSGTLTYEVVKQLTDKGLGQTTCLGIGGDPVIGTNFIDALTLFEADPKTEAIVLMGEIGGSDEGRSSSGATSPNRSRCVARRASGAHGPRRHHSGGTAPRPRRSRRSRRWGPVLRPRS